ncbi:MAG TPA: hypothetical protein VE270_12115, partial [Thermoleophilaceae bacterium]|nr:hypothetical protein [Thermoleophilaceae bacterium]
PHILSSVRVTVCGVGPRDGLRNEASVLAPAVRGGAGEPARDGRAAVALIKVAEWLEGVLERQLPGQVYRAGTFAPVAG